ncbi:MAG TPA: competence/damage-inducible protein A [Verrucomicrobiae bacterium]|nr:competence/damage-inducible protein A [Verrucomicrobiae bacterium]
MVVEILNTGSELMLGRVLNTHQQWLCAQLADLGYVVSRQTAVPDTAAAIRAGVQEALGRADLLIATGGLGPTSDDLTRDVLARFLERPLHEDPAILEQITSFFTSRKRPMPASTRVQALVPEGALVLHNAFGTAPGLALEVPANRFRPGAASSWLVMLPGPPRELRPMFTEQVVPLLRRVLPAAAKFVCHTWRTSGLGESMVEQTVAPAIEGLVARGLELGYCARPGQVDVRLVARGDDAEVLVREAERILQARLGAVLYGRESDEEEAVLIRRLTELKRTLALAESCTGGLLAHRLTNVPGASAVVLGGFVTYNNDIKQKFLGVRPETLAEHGAVSEAVARQMAEGARRVTGADVALALTGIAGPSGGTDAKPVGTLFIALAAASETVVEHHLNPYDRETFKQVSTQQAMDLLRRRLGPESPCTLKCAC